VPAPPAANGEPGSGDRLPSACVCTPRSCRAGGVVGRTPVPPAQAGSRSRRRYRERRRRWLRPGSVRAARGFRVGTHVRTRITSPCIGDPADETIRRLFLRVSRRGGSCELLRRCRGEGAPAAAADLDEGPARAASRLGTPKGRRSARGCTSRSARRRSVSSTVVATSSRARHRRRLGDRRKRGARHAHARRLRHHRHTRSRTGSRVADARVRLVRLAFDRRRRAPGVQCPFDPIAPSTTCRCSAGRSSTAGRPPRRHRLTGRE
jgi:hypothetical protein